MKKLTKEQIIADDVARRYGVPVQDGAVQLCPPFFRTIDLSLSMGFREQMRVGFENGKANHRNKLIKAKLAREEIEKEERANREAAALAERLSKRNLKAKFPCLDGESDQDALRRLHALGVSSRNVADALGISRSTVIKHASKLGLRFVRGEQP